MILYRCNIVTYNVEYFQKNNPFFSQSQKREEEKIKHITFFDEENSYHIIYFNKYVYNKIGSLIFIIPIGFQWYNTFVFVHAIAYINGILLVHGIPVFQTGFF